MNAFWQYSQGRVTSEDKKKMKTQIPYVRLTETHIPQYSAPAANALLLGRRMAESALQISAPTLKYSNLCLVTTAINNILLHAISLPKLSGCLNENRLITNAKTKKNINPSYCCILAFSEELESNMM